jgi:hypothetical protein
MYKRTTYTNPRGTAVGVAYVILDDQTCVFSALDDSTHGSSINYAEEIISAIVAAERINPFSLQFFDLQTSTSYRHWCTHEADPFEFDAVMIAPSAQRKPGFVVTCWQPAPCPEAVIRLFADLIGPVPRQKVPRSWSTECPKSFTHSEI